MAKKLPIRSYLKQHSKYNTITNTNTENDLQHLPQQREKQQQQQLHQQQQQQQLHHQQQQQQQGKKASQSNKKSYLFVRRIFFILGGTLFSIVLTIYQHAHLVINANNNTSREQPKLMEQGLPEQQQYGGFQLNNRFFSNVTLTSSSAAETTTTAARPSNDAKNSNKKVIAYAISYIKCTVQDDVGMRDAAMVMRHSIHQIHKDSTDYTFKMYALVHRNAVECSGKQLEEWGFHIKVVDPPVQKSEIRGEHLRTHIQREFCCGADEFIKLYAYTLPEEIIVHVDIDFVFLKPMDHLFDAMLYDKDHPRGVAARNKLELEMPSDKLPDKINVFWTRDWGQVAPEKFPPGYQAGFLVARRDPTVLTELVEIIKEGNYSDGWGYTYGWGNKGYGGYIGAMAMQGLLAYYYDHFRTNDAVELNHCRYNHMGMDAKYRGGANFRLRFPHVGKCRNIRKGDDCEDCMVTDISLIYSVHYTVCRKPWMCMGTGRRIPVGEPSGAKATVIDTNIVHLEHCLELLHGWHDVRTDFENQLYALTKDDSIQLNGPYMPEIFNGHCQDDGIKSYLPIGGSPETIRRSIDLY